MITGLENQSKRSAKKTFVDWTEAADSAFEHLKKLCISTPILAYPDYKLPFVLHTDSSSEGLGAVLYQKQNGKLRVIAYASRSVSKAESHYPAHKLEFLALKWAVCEKFHEYLYGSNMFEVYTDNNPLTYVLSSAKLDACGQRWVAKLANYNFTIKYKCGLSNVEADALSRISWPEVLADTEDLDVDLNCMDTHVVNAILAGSRSKTSLIESVSCSSKIIPDIDVFASDTEESSLQSIQNDSSVQPTDSDVTQSVVEDEPENVVSVEITEPRRSGSARKQTALYGNPLLYTITCKLTPRFVPAFFNKMSETLELLHSNYLKDSDYDDVSKYFLLYICYYSLGN